MKKLFLLLLSLFLVLSCSKEDDVGTSSSSLVGKWDEIRSLEYYDDDEDSPYEEIPEPGTYIYEITNRYITLHSEDPSVIFSGSPIEYTYYPEDGEMTYLGFQIKVNFEGNNRLILTSHNGEGKFVTYLDRLE